MPPHNLHFVSAIDSAFFITIINLHHAPALRGSEEEGPSRGLPDLTDHRLLPLIKSNSCTAEYGCVREHMLGEDDGVKDGSQNTQRITLVGGPEHSYSAARMGFYVHVLGGQRGPYGVCWSHLLESG